MAVAINKCIARVRVSDAHIHDVKATKKMKNKKKENTCLMYMEIVTSQNLI